MEIGYKIYKPCESQEELDIYSQVAEWCNNNNAHIEDKGEYYEVVENAPAEEIPIVATWQDRIEAQVMYTALLTDSLLEEGEE